MGNVQSTLTVKLIDDVSGAAHKIEAELHKAERAVKELAKAGVSSRLGQQLTKMGASAADIDKVSAAWKKYASAEKLAASSADWTKAQTASVRAWENATVAAVRNVVRAENEAARSQQRLAERAARQAAIVQRQHAGGAHGPLKVLGGGHGVFAGPVILHATKQTVEAGAEIQSEKVKMRAAGIPEREVSDAEDRSAQLAAKYTNVKRADILERYKELRSVLTHPDETPHMLEPVVKANAAMNAIDRTGHMAEGLTFAVKGAEVLGLAQDPKRFANYLEAFIKAQQVMGKTITPEQMYEFAKYTKASGATLSDRFKLTTGVSLSQEMGGSTAGVGVDQFVKQVIGGFQGSQHSAAKEFVALGLANKDDFEKTKTGEIKGFKPGRHVKDYQLAQSDPDQWVHKVLTPALEAKGFKTLDEQLGEVRRLFPSGRAADIVSKIIQQRESLENHAKLYEHALGFNAIGTNQTDPFVALNSLSTSLTNFAATLSSPMMQTAASVMSGMASSVGQWQAKLAEWQKENPTSAKVAAGTAATAGAVGGGVLTYQLLTGLTSGFGLKGSAVALDGSAAALTGAARVLAGGKLGDAAGGLAGAAKEGKAASALKTAGKATLVGAGALAVIEALQAIPKLDGGYNPRTGGAERRKADEVAAAAKAAAAPPGDTRTFWQKLWDPKGRNRGKPAAAAPAAAASEPAPADAATYGPQLPVPMPRERPGAAPHAAPAPTPTQTPAPASAAPAVTPSAAMTMPDTAAFEAAMRAAGERSGAAFNASLSAQLEQAKAACAAAASAMQASLSFTATPKINAPAVSGGGGSSGGGKQSARDTSQKLGRLIDNQTRGSFLDHEFA